MISVAIDCDGVLRDFDSEVRKLAKERLNIDYNPTSWSDLFNLFYENRSLGSFVFNEWASDIFTKAPVIKGAFQGYMKFINNPNIYTYVVTTQSKEHEQYTKIWLERESFDKHEKTHFLKDKTKVPCQVLIDDKYDNVKSYLDKARMGILINAPWNEGYSVPRRANNLIEAYEQILPYTNE